MIIIYFQALLAYSLKASQINDYMPSSFIEKSN